MFWKLEEARLVQFRSATSGAGATNVSLAASPVPAGKVWVVLGFSYYPSAAETRTIGFRKITPSGAQIALLNPLAMLLNPFMATFIEQGMEYLLFPGEYVYVDRDAATAGSTMTIQMQFVEIDLPLYTYEEPQEVKRQGRAISSLRARLAGGVGGSVTRPPTMTGERGGRGGPLEK